ncbi:MAG TPA: beta-L-arabinofuranosidase domain-containing protein, partial [Bacillota bacterium]|nr:beta-L-arabinofuranosidase domain-containing protein [Bacillota bacterium]
MSAVKKDRFKNSQPLALKNIQIQDSFWSNYSRLVREVVIPYQWEALNDRIPGVEPSHGIRNFRIAAGEITGEFGGMVFQDSDLAKWLEAVGYNLQTHPDPGLETLADEAIDLLAKAQQPDGYLNTYFTLREPDRRWTNLVECHELYCAGHLIEAAVAYYQGTGKRKFLDIMRRYADYIDSVFGPEPEKMHGYCGHEEIELALVKLYEVTGEEKYLNLCKFFIDERGREPNYFLREWEIRGGISHWAKGPTPPPDLKYHQAHLPVREQTVAVGHSVRAVYLYTAMADIAAWTGDRELGTACRRLWNSIVSEQMYLTGGIGSAAQGEAFTFSYHLPNDTAYSETCAAIGLIFFGFRMLQMEPNSMYADIIERALYNTVIAGMALDGRHFFYVNPLEVWPEACEKDPGQHHVKPSRPGWFGCACCPPNLARLLASLGQYVYTYNDTTIYTHLYIGGEAVFEMSPVNGGACGDSAGNDNPTIVLHQETNYPWDGKVALKVGLPSPREFTIGLRLPGWGRALSLRVNGVLVNVSSILADGYALLKRVWSNGDRIELDLEMPVELIQANPKVRENAGKVAIQRGPLVYCLEEADNGPNLAAISLELDSKLTASFDEDFGGGAVVIEGTALRTDESSWDNTLYRPWEVEEKPIVIKAIPYFMWGNRKPG